MTACWETEKECAVSCGMSQQQLCCRECRAVGNPSAAQCSMPETESAPGWSVAQGPAGTAVLPALPGLLWAGLRRVLSVGA